MKRHDGNDEVKLRPAEDVEQSTWALYQKAKNIKDTAKLWTMVPAFCKPRELPTRHEKGEFTFAELRHVPGASPRLPNLCTKRAAHKPNFPYLYSTETTAEYVRKFEAQNNLIHAPITFMAAEFL